MKVNVMDVKSKYEAMVADGKAAVVKGIACGPAGSKQQVAKQVCVKLFPPVTRQVDCPYHMATVWTQFLTTPLQVIMHGWLTTSEACCHLMC